MQLGECRCTIVGVVDRERAHDEVEEAVRVGQRLAEPGPLDRGPVTDPCAGRGPPSPVRRRSPAPLRRPRAAPRHTSRVRTRRRVPGAQSWGGRQWQAYLDRPHLRHWVALLNGEPIGLLSLDMPPGGDVEVDTFGLLPDYLGRGLGGHLLTLGTRLAWDAAAPGSRVWLHTSDRDHPAALPNYRRRGFREYQLGPGLQASSPVP